MIGVTVLAALAPASGIAQGSYPTKPIRLIVPFAAGGSTDSLARIVAPELGRRLGQTVLVDNRAGAGGNIGIDAVAKADPDGYTIGLGSPGPLVVNVTLMDALPYDPVKDLAPIALIADLPIVLVVHSSVPANDVASLIAADKANPGNLFFASAGTGTTMHLSGELLNVMAGTKLQHVPYKGTGLAITDLLAGRVQVGFLDLPSVGPHLDGGKVKILAVGNRKRALSAPNVPTIAESGVRGYETSGWFGVVAPARVPPAILKSLNEALVDVMAMPEIRSRLLAIGVEPTSSTPEQFGQFIRDEIPKWAKVIETSGSKVKR
ncbi:MAG: tripartite tricarboxylate transporter substrate binding protein [Rubrivivax sp.]|nr:tripartite tricarboxylate transporter substrate binding protein [Rubrivivax sp.]